MSDLLIYNANYNCYFNSISININLIAINFEKKYFLIIFRYYFYQT